MVVGMFAVFSAMCPLLYSDLGLRVLKRSILDWAVREQGPES